MPTLARILLVCALFPLIGLPTLGSCARADEPLFAPRFVEDLTRQVLEALDQGAGIILPDPVPIVVLSAEEAAGRRARYAKTLGDEATLTASMDVLADLMFSTTMLGRYLPDEKVIYIIEDVLLRISGGDEQEAAEVLFPLLAHELVHAYDDQVYGAVPNPADFEELLAEPEAMPQLQALMGLVEGRATYASELACDHAGREPLPVPTMDSARRARVLDSDGSLMGDAVAGLGNAVVRLKMVQYAQGREFARRAHSYGGEPFFRHVFGQLPLSLDELEDFNRFVVRWAESLEDAEVDAEADGPVGG